MAIRIVVAVAVLLGVTVPSHSAAVPSDSAVERKIDSVMARLTIDEKIGVITGAGRRNPSQVLKDLGLQWIRMSDGPAGVSAMKGQFTCFPASAAIAASFDTTMVRRVGEAIGNELKAHGGNCLLAPCVNINRLPLGGRNFESFGEDPFLASRMAVSYVEGVQSQGVISTIKHFALNNQEWSRVTVNVIVSERAMREIYFPAFEAAVKEAHVWAFMSGLNKLNGTYCSENKYLLTDVLKNGWGYRGIVVSDAGGTHSGVASINAGHDMASPGNFYSRDTIQLGVKNGLIPESRINDWVGRLLRVSLALGLAGTPVPGDTTIDRHKPLALEVACKGIVLLKNDNRLLPLSTKSIHTLAVIGPSAAIARTGGWGSSFVNPPYAITPLEGIRTRVGDSVTIRHELGVEHMPVTWKPIGARFVHAPGGTAGKWKGEYFNTIDPSGSPALVREDSTVSFDWAEGSPDPSIKTDSFSVRWTGSLTVDSSREYSFTAWADDGIRFYVNDSLLIDVWIMEKPTNHAAKIFLQKDKPYSVKVEYNDIHLGASIQLLWDWPAPAIDTARFNAAILAAKSCDAAVLFVGSSDSIEGEDHDRTEMELPGFQSALVAAVAKVNPRTIVVINGGTPAIVKPWIDHVPSLIQAFFLGQETGSSLAKVIFGDVNPSGRLPYSYIAGYDQSPAFKDYRAQSVTARYDEGIYVGYRYLDKNNLTPSFPFGHGLSYTTFEYSKIKTRKLGPQSFDVDVTVQNTGTRPGREIVQTYVSEPKCSVDRPVKELKAFTPVDLAPGEKKTVTMHLDSRSFAYYDTVKASWVVEPGKFEILMGASSRDIRLTKKISVR